MKKRYCILLFSIGIIGLWLTFSHIYHFKFPDYFYNENPSIEKYIGTNVVSPMADFSYFTYQTVIIFSVWCILLSISEMFKINALMEFLKNSYVMTFIFTNYIITTVLYTIFEFASGNPTFGYYGPYNLSIHNLGTNIIAHYLLFIICLICYIFIKPISFNNKKLSYTLITFYLVIYYVYVKLTGMYAYNIEWYPYIIFDQESIENLINIKNHYLGLFIFLMINIFIYIVYMVLYKTLTDKKQKTINKVRL